MSPVRARPETTAALARGVCRFLVDLGYAPLLEVTLGNGRRADVMGLSARGEILIVETKSGLPDWRADGKWPDYLGFCDAFFLAVTTAFPLEAAPADVGLIVADGFGGAILRAPAARPPLAGARRKAVTLAYARTAAARLHAKA